MTNDPRTTTASDGIDLTPEDASDAPDVSVVIVNFHTLPLVFDAVDSVIEKTQNVTFEIIVVDNASEPEFEASVKARYGIRVRTLALPENAGFGRANNAALPLARGRHIFFLNPDTILVNDAISILSRYLDADSSAGACGGNLFHPDMRPAPSFRRILPGPFWELSERLRRHPERMIYGRNTRFNHSHRPKEVGYITGADLMVRRTVIDSTGGFAPEFFMYFEETDLCARIRKKGFRIMSVPEAKIIHLEGASFAQKTPEEQKAANERKLSYYRQSRDIYYARNLSPRLTALAAFFRK